MEKIEAGISHAKARLKSVQSTHSLLRRDHLCEWMLKAEASGDRKKINEIKTNMERKGSRKMWFFVNRL